MLEKLKKLFKSKDNKPVMVSFILARDSCSRLLTDFGEKDLEGCKSLVILWESEDGVEVRASENICPTQVLGLLVMAQRMVEGG